MTGSLCSLSWIAYTLTLHRANARFWLSGQAALAWSSNLSAGLGSRNTSIIDDE